MRVNGSPTERRSTLSRAGWSTSLTQKYMSKIQTYSGKVFDYLNPTADMIDIEDIAHALSQICRYTGHTTEFYSVAKHSVLASELVPDHLALPALLHDATEAYTGDMNKPLKELLPDFRAVEEKIWIVIAEKFGLPYTMDPIIHDVDMALLHAESIRYLPPCEDPHLWDKVRTSYPKCMIPGYVVDNNTSWRRRFLERFEVLTKAL